MIDPAFRVQVDAALAEVERCEGVRVLLAVESGSRAWGFASRDSDYDVRFIYARPLADYLAVTTPRDVIERPVDGLLDLGGWDVRKALGLAVRSNAVLLEWLASPVVYRRDPAASDLAALAQAAAHLPALEHHYDRLARGAWSAGADGPIRLKSYFYALRPALALLWLRCHRTPPPMSLPALLDGVLIPSDVTTDIEALQQRKAVACEADVVPRQPVVDAFLAAVLAAPVNRPGPWTSTMVHLADQLLRRLLGVGEPGTEYPLQPLPE